MFFGRTEELAYIHDLLRTDTGIIYIRGQKRVGKTSLLLHLKDHYLNRFSMLPVFIDFQILSRLDSSASFHDVANTIYTQLQFEEQLSELVEPPLKEFFDTSPPAAFIEYLHSVQTHLGSSTLILLIDEFSRTIDAYRQGSLDEAFFQQWRGVLQKTAPKVNYVMVVQQQTYDSLLEHTQQRVVDPIWPLLEMGETLVLKPLSEKDARQLIEQPTHNYLEYSPEALRYVWRLTGGSPFLIQAFCYNLVRYMARSNRQRVERDDVCAIQADFMNPDESLFAHLLDMINGVAQSICQQLTYFVDETDQPVPLAELNQTLPHIPIHQVVTAVRELTERHVLIQPKPNAYQFASLLFGRWLAQHTVLKQFESSSP
jgi:branched-chain amino acid transport system substrate-binding protein